MDEEPARSVTLELSPGQREVIKMAAGVDLRNLRYTRTEAAGVALLAAAVAAGHTSMASTRLIAFDLTPAQSGALHAVLGGRAPTRWLADGDHVRVRYAEDWTVVHAAPLGATGLAVSASSVEPPEGKLLVLLPQVAASTDVFGTGHHPATRLAAQLLEDLLVPGSQVADVGTGSGVLAVFAVRLGAAHVRAIDTSPPAIEAAARTVELNACADQIELKLGELDGDGPPVDLLVANILAGTLLGIMPRLARNVRPGGILVTSGVVDLRVDEIIGSAGENGLVHCRSLSSKGWTASAFRRC